MSNAAQQQKPPTIDYKSTYFLVPDEGREGEDIRHAILSEHSAARVVTSLPVQRLAESTSLVIVIREPEPVHKKRQRQLDTKNARRAAAATGMVANIPARPLALRYVGPVACKSHWNPAEDKLNIKGMTREFGARIVPATFNMRDEGAEIGRVLRVRYA